MTFANNSKYSITIALLIYASLITSCVSVKKSVYFNDLPDSVVQLQSTEFKEPVIQPDDILSVSIMALDQQTFQITNQIGPSHNAGPAGSSSAISGYLVDKEGNINLAIIGKVKLKGLTTSQARDTIYNKAADYFKSSTIHVQFANFKITVLGEVNKPSSYIIPNERFTIIDAIGMAGDLTIYGNRENVLLVRDSNGLKTFVRFNLNSKESFQSPYFYLKQNDVIYIQPTKAKVAQTNIARTQTITIVLSVVSLLVVIFSRVL